MEVNATIVPVRGIEVTSERDLVCSTGTMPDAVGRRYHDIEAVRDVAASIPVRAVEVVLHPDWRPGIPPRSEQPDPPAFSPDYCPDEIVERMGASGNDGGFRVSSVHANRDLGAFLSSADPSDRKTGSKILLDAVKVAEGCEANTVVMHLWDSWSADARIREAAAVLTDASSVNRSVVISVENIPVSARGPAQIEIMRMLDQLLPDRIGFTLDLSWSSMYDNLCELAQLLPRVNNVHVQGKLSGDERGPQLIPRSGNLDLESAIRLLRRKGYNQQWTLELNRPRDITDFRVALDYLARVVQ